MYNLIKIGMNNGKEHYAMLKTQKDCFGKIYHWELWSIRSGDMEYITKYGITLCVRYYSFEAMQEEMTSVCNNCKFTWDDTEFQNILKAD